MDVPIKLQFCNIDQFCSFTNGFNITTKVKLVETNLAPYEIEFSDIFIMGMSSPNKFRNLSTIQFSYPKRLASDGLDELWLTISEKALGTLAGCSKLYLVIEIIYLKHNESYQLVYELTSPDWLNYPWSVSVIGYDQKSNTDSCASFTEALISAKETHTTIQEFDKKLSTLLFRRALQRNHTFLEKRKIAADTIKIHIVESELGYVKAGNECFFILIELENASEESRAFEISNFRLYDCEEVNLTLVGYINDISPTSAPLAPGTKDRFYVGFKTDKTRQKEASLTLKFNIHVFGYSELFEESICFESIGRDYTETINQITPPNLLLPKNSPEYHRPMEKIERLTQQLRKSFYSFGEDNGLLFDKITLSYSDNGINVLGLVKKQGNRPSDTICLVALGSNKIIKTQTILLYSLKNSKSWYTFDEHFYNIPLHELSSIIVTN